ncbi:hypothetical protein BU17DRAFT_74712 [Hysterangium stoloniferum]|nr:hypothetical protein BU17DRAFT_74712 [Hysterangium stoloniferum]
MALNWVTLNDTRQPVPIGEEHNVMVIGTGVEMVLSVPSQQSGGTPTKLKETGGIWLTDQRLIFVRGLGTGHSPLDTLSIPLASLLSTSFQQPTFSANYLLVDIKPSLGGGLTEGAKAEIRLKDQGMFGFVSALEKMRERALFMKRESALEDELPLYTSPSTVASSSATPLNISATTRPPADAPPGYDA